MKITPKFCVDYPIVVFKANDGVTQTLRGRGVGKFLVVAQVPFMSKTYKVYRRFDGKPAYDISFSDPDFAVSFADWLDTEFADYMDIWVAMPDADIIGLTKWAVEHGIQIFETMMTASGKTIKDQKELETLYVKAKDRVEYWTRGLSVYTG